jgi:MOSC domain-containing protein YiiM
MVEFRICRTHGKAKCNCSLNRGALNGGMNAQIIAVLTGKVDPAFSPEEASAIAKRAIDGPVAIGPLGLTGDEQADRVHHGGPDKAIHVYPFDHYSWWTEELGAQPLLNAPGGFGENLSSAGLTEDQVCIGDRFRVGTALIEVSHGRKPCWKLAHRFGDPQMVAKVAKSRRSGWYCRVIETGLVAAGDGMELIERPLPQWNVARVFGLLVGKDYIREPEAAADLAGMEVLAEAWRIRAIELAGQR